MEVTNLAAQAKRRISMIEMELFKPDKRTEAVHEGDKKEKNR